MRWDPKIYRVVLVNEWWDRRRQTPIVFPSWCAVPLGDYWAVVGRVMVMCQPFPLNPPGNWRLTAIHYPRGHHGPRRWALVPLRSSGSLEYILLRYSWLGGGGWWTTRWYWPYPSLLQSCGWSWQHRWFEPGPEHDDFSHFVPRHDLLVSMVERDS